METKKIKLEKLTIKSFITGENQQGEKTIIVGFVTMSIGSISLIIGATAII